MEFPPSAPPQGAPGLAPLPSLPSVVPLPGLHLPGKGTLWNPPRTDFLALPQAPGSIHQPPPPARRGAIQQTQLRATQERRASLDAQYALPLPNWTQQATPYLQQVQPPAWPPPPLLRSDSVTTPVEEPAPPEGRGRSDAQSTGGARGQSRSRDRARSHPRDWAQSQVRGRPPGAARGR